MEIIEPPSFSWLKKDQETRTFRSLSAMRWLVVLECLARFLYYETNLHVALVPLLPVCRALAAWNTSLQDLLDNTIRVVAQYQLAFAVGPTAVTFMVRTGRRARRMPRRGQTNQPPPVQDGGRGVGHPGSISHLLGGADRPKGRESRRTGTRTVATDQEMQVLIQVANLGRRFVKTQGKEMKAQKAKMQGNEGPKSQNERKMKAQKATRTE